MQINLSPISIPVSSTPEKPPPVGLYYLYFEPNGTLVRMDWNNAVERMTSKVSIHEVELAQRLDILQITNVQTVQVEKEQAETLNTGDKVQIAGAIPQSNNGIYTISSIEDVQVIVNPFDFFANENPQPEKVNITFSDANFNPFVFQFGELIIPKWAVINHTISDPLAVNFKSLETNEAGLNIKHFLNNQSITIQPETPISGVVRVSVLG